MPNFDLSQRVAFVTGGNGGIGLGVLGETDKAETTAATGVAVLDDNLRWSVTVA